MVQGQVFLGGRGGGGSEHSFCHHNFMKKGSSKLPKNKPEDIP